MRITSGGELVDIDKAIAILAIIKPDNTSQAQFLEVKEGKVYADLNTNMKDQVGRYKAQALLIYEDERVSTDIIEYEVTEDSILNQLEATVDATEDFRLLQDMLSRLSTIELAEPYYEKISDDKLILEIPNSASLSVDSVIPCQNIKAIYTGNVPSVYAMENSILDIEEHNVDMVATTFDMDYRLLEVEWALEDAGLTGISLASTFNLNTKGVKTMALSRYEQAKIMILGGAYDKATLTKQLTRYLEKDLITQEEYDELIALMEAKDLVTGK